MTSNLGVRLPKSLAISAVARRLNLINFVDLAFSAVRHHHIDMTKNAGDFNLGIHKNRCL
jgi:hypothetical protein